MSDYSRYSRTSTDRSISTTFLNHASGLLTGVRMYHHGYVPGVMSLQVIRDGIRQLIKVPFPLRTGTAGHVLCTYIIYNIV